jgi:hypothetical protein
MAKDLRPKLKRFWFSTNRNDPLSADAALS